ncbi:MAG: hypothetical protein ORN51_12295 [Akkermansiaceae bacterium]|nr:hypothetical protein [Akkermansiaceae bacterium]
MHPPANYLHRLEFVQVRRIYLLFGVFSMTATLDADINFQICFRSCPSCQEAALNATTTEKSFEDQIQILTPVSQRL